jgi:N-acetylneuraminate synthase
VTFIIAELGINHNGSVDLAEKLIDAAAACGADAVKFQKRTVDIVYAGQLDNPRESPWGTTVRAQKEALELSEKAYDRIAKYCKDMEMPWFASCWDIPSLEFMRKYDCPYNKIASAMVTNLEFVQKVADDNKPTFLSTAMCNVEDIAEAIAWFPVYPKRNLTLMHCVGTYPAAEKDLNLNTIIHLHKLFRLPVGYSGHETSVSPSVMAAVLGAVAIERHLTLDKSMYGSDQAASLEPVAFKTMVEQIRKIPKVLGDGVKRVLEEEKAVAKKLRYWE